MPRLEHEEGTCLTLLAEIKYGHHETDFKQFRLKSKDFTDAITPGLQDRIIKALDVQLDEEIIVTFTKRRKSPGDTASDTASDTVPDMHVGETLIPRTTAEQSLDQLRAINDTASRSFN